MTALAAASTARTDHEVTVHDYHHVRLADEHVFTPYRRPTPKTASGV
ncbi:MAG TPA: hypothetical protein VGQ86_01915 [Candidatus Limnocylindria bacterium]|nr:hypothetical protein [Candidatus Limnocylindria bacterium]